MHPLPRGSSISRRSAEPKSKPNEDTAAYWNQKAQLSIDAKLKTLPNTGKWFFFKLKYKDS